MVKDKFYYRKRREEQADFVINPPTKEVLEVRESCKYDLKRFCELVFPRTVSLSWSEEHIIYLFYLQDIILNGGRQAVAMPRGVGKTTLAVLASLWAILYGHRKFLLIISATQQLSEDFIRRVKTMIETVDKLEEWFPYDITPFKALGGVAQRTKTQRYHGQPTYIEYKTNQIIFPAIPEANAVSSIIETAGLTGGRIRGRQHALPGGQIIRPDLVIVDDPQTKESARSQSQCAYRLSVINGDILMLGGSNVEIATLITCTVIESGDVADVLLDRKLSPQWRGLRVKALKSLPKNLDLWRRYGEIRAECLRVEDDREKYDSFYKKHWEAMHDGVDSVWEGFKKPQDIDALQSLMHVWLDNPIGFASEYQNEPIKADETCKIRITEHHIQRMKVNLGRGEIPPETYAKVAYCDINYYGVHYVIGAFKRNGSMHIVDFGKFPPSSDLWDPKQSIITSQQAIYNAIYHLGTEFSKMRLDLVGVDCGFEMDTVFQACATVWKETGLKIFPGRGQSQGQFKVKNPIGHVGDGVYLTNYTQRGQVIVINVDKWKLRVLQAFNLAPNAPSSITIFDGGFDEMVNFTRHLTSEILVDHYERNGEEKFEWRLKPGSRNDLFDATVGAFALGSLLGFGNPSVQMVETNAVVDKSYKRVKRASYTDV